MYQEKEQPVLPLTPGPWTYQPFETTWRVCTPDDAQGHGVVIAELIQPSQANAALIAAAPRMLDILLRWNRAHDFAGCDLLTEARELLGEIEQASAGPW